MSKKPDRACLKEFADACREIGHRGLARCSSGNFSLRIGDDRMLIKSSRAWLEEVTVDDISICRISDGTSLNGKKPSVEVGFHAGILRGRPDVNVVLHFQTPCATAVACTGRRQLNYFVTPEIPYYIGPVAQIPFLSPGSQQLADAVVKSMMKHDMMQLVNHGQVTVGKDCRQAIQNACFFEMACEIILRTGFKAKPISPKAVRALGRNGAVPKAI